MLEPKHTRPGDGADCRNLRRELRHKRPGTLLSMKHELRVMLPQGAGASSMSRRLRSVGLPGASVYVASKHAIEGLTKSAALEVAGTGVRVNVVAPGTTDTGMLTRSTSTDENKSALVDSTVKRLAKPEEIAHVIAFVASANACTDWRFHPGGRRNDRRQTSSKAPRLRKCGHDQHTMHVKWRKESNG